MAVKAKRVTVTTSPTKINSKPTDGQSGAGGQARNRGASSVFVGGSDVTTATGYEVEAGDVIAFDLDHGEDIYGIVASGTCVMHVLEGGT